MALQKMHSIIFQNQYFNKIYLEFENIAVITIINLIKLCKIFKIKIIKM